MITRTDDLVQHVAFHAGTSPEVAEHATRLVLAAIGAHLSDDDRQLFADELPQALATALVSGNVALPLEAQLVPACATVGHARELVAAACRALAEEVSDEVVRAVELSVPEPIARYFVAGAAVHQTRTSLHAGHTLADGRPGSRHPLAETPPSRAQGESVAAENPHGATKLSSTPGSTQERRHETLSEDAPDRTRTLAESRPQR